MSDTSDKSFWRINRPSLLFLLLRIQGKQGFRYLRSHTHLQGTSYRKQDTP